VECSARREIDKAVLRQLATCRWIEEHHTVLISGATAPVTLYTTSLTPRNHSRSRATSVGHGRCLEIAGNWRGESTVSLLSTPNLRLSSYGSSSPGSGRVRRTAARLRTLRPAW
jgi:hypothetical protein